MPGSIADPTFGGLISGLGANSLVLYDRVLTYSGTDNPILVVDVDILTFFKL